MVFIEFYTCSLMEFSRAFHTSAIFSKLHLLIRLALIVISLLVMLSYLDFRRYEAVTLPENHEIDLGEIEHLLPQSNGTIVMDFQPSYIAMVYNFRLLQ